MDLYNIAFEDATDESTDEESYRGFSSDDDGHKKSTKRKTPTKKTSKKPAPKRTQRKSDEHSMMCKDILGLDNLPFWCQCAHKKFCMRDRWWTEVQWKQYIERCKGMNSFVPLHEAKWLHVAIQTLEFHRNHDWKGERGQQFFEIYQHYQNLRKIKLKVDDSDLYPSDANISSKKRRKVATHSPDRVSSSPPSISHSGSSDLSSPYYQDYSYHVPPQPSRQPSYLWQPLQSVIAAELPLIPSPVHATAQSLLTLAQPPREQPLYQQQPFQPTNLHRISVSALIN